MRQFLDQDVTAIHSPQDSTTSVRSVTAKWVHAPWECCPAEVRGPPASLGLGGLSLSESHLLPGHAPGTQGPPARLTADGLSAEELRAPQLGDCREQVGTWSPRVRGPPCRSGGCVRSPSRTPPSPPRACCCSAGRHLARPGAGRWEAKVLPARGEEGVPLPRQELYHPDLRLADWGACPQWANWQSASLLGHRSR